MRIQCKQVEKAVMMVKLGQKLDLSNHLSIHDIPSHFETSTSNVTIGKNINVSVTTLSEDISFVHSGNIYTLGDLIMLNNDKGKKEQ